MTPRTRELAIRQTDSLIETAVLSEKINATTAAKLRRDIEAALDEKGGEFPYLTLTRRGKVTVEWLDKVPSNYGEMDMS